MGIIDWLNANDGVIIGIATVILVSITGYYAYLTWRMLKANNTPEIAISLRPHEAQVNAVMLCIENIGTGTAHNLQFIINPPSIPNLDRPFEKIGFLQNGIAYFEPGRKIEQFLVSVFGKYEELKQTPFEMKIIFNDSVGKEHKRIFNLDIGEYEGFSQLGTPPLYEIAKTTKKLQEDINRIATGSRKPVILTERLSEHRIRNYTDFLESRISQFPPNIQERVLQKLEFFIDEQDREIREKAENDEETTSDKHSS